MKEVYPNKRTSFFSRLLCRIGIHDRFVMKIPSFQEEAFDELRGLSTHLIEVANWLDVQAAMYEPDEYTFE